MNFRVVPAAAACTLVLALAAPSSAQQFDPDANAQGELSITIYNNGQSLVQDVRQLPITAGRSRIEFPDVSAQIRPETLSFNAAGTAIVEQNFDYDLLSPGKLMEKALGQTITLVRTNPATGAETRERATILSVAGGVIVRIGDRIEVLRDDGLPVRAVFDRVPPNLRAKPTLSVTLQSDRAGTRPASIRYLTPGLGWSADYVALYNETAGTIDVQGWVTLNNSTGTSFRDGNVLLVAGNAGSGGYSPPRGMVRPGTQSSNRERLGDFYLYPIAGRTTIANAQTKQISFLDVQGVKASKVYERQIGWMSSDSGPVNVSSAIAFSTSRQGGLGDALPAGTVRFYQRDARNSPQFIGESGIGHTPTGSELSLTTGSAFDVLVQAEVTKREKITSAEWERSVRWRVIRNGQVTEQVEAERPVDYYRTSMRYKLTNARSQPATVSVVQAGLDRGWWSNDYRVVSESLKGEQDGLDRRKWDVPVPANGEAEVTVTFETRY